jgi:hypothetical protein
MLCQLCLVKLATYSVTDKLPSGRLGMAYYCPDCYEAKYVKPPPDVGEFPRPRFTIKNILIVVAVWAVPNAMVAWVMRSGYITGTPDELRQWTVVAFLIVNVALAYVIGFSSLVAWLGKVMWFHRTGGVVPIPNRTLTPRQWLRLLVTISAIGGWAILSAFVTRWLSPPPSRHFIPLLILISWAPLVLILVYPSPKNRFWRERVRQDWKTASVRERVLRAMAIGLPIALVAMLLVGGRYLAGWGTKPFIMLFAVGAVSIIAIQTALMAAVAFSMRRR